MKCWLTIALVYGLVSCGDVNRSETLEKIAHLSTVLEATTEYLDVPVTDSLTKAVELGYATKMSIKEKLGGDTLTMERAVQIDEYARYILEFEHLQAQIPIVRSNVAEIQRALNALKSDIDQEAGNRAKYADQIKLEEMKAMTLMTKIDSISKIKNEGLEAFYELHNKVSDFSLNLEEKKEEE
jgi:hypothetical protein